MLYHVMPHTNVYTLALVLTQAACMLCVPPTCELWSPRVNALTFQGVIKKCSCHTLVVDLLICC